MVRFLHTADWQLGMPGLFLGSDAQARFSAARLDAIVTIGRVAVDESCEFVVVCGDVFDSNQPPQRVLLQAFEKLASTPEIDFFLLPGNHDPLDSHSIYRSERFTKNQPDNVKVLSGPEPVPTTAGVELVPAPWLNKYPTHDLVGAACEGLGPTAAVRIVVGHGQVDSRSPDPSDSDTSASTLISLDRVKARIESGLIHYVALGDHHSTKQVDTTGRVWYSGAPEPTRFSEREPGNVLVVDLDEADVDVTVRPVGTWKFMPSEWELGAVNKIGELEEWLSDLEDKDRTIVKVSIAGQVSVAQKARLDSAIEHYDNLFAALDVRDGDLVVVPDEGDPVDLGLSGFAGDAQCELAGMANDSSNEEQASVAREALALLIRLTTSGE